MPHCWRRQENQPYAHAPCALQSHAMAGVASPGQEKERSALLHTLGTVQALVSGSRQKPAGSGAEAGGTAAVGSLLTLQCRCNCWKQRPADCRALSLCQLHASSWSAPLRSPGWLSRNSATQVQVHATSDQLPAEGSGAGKSTVGLQARPQQPCHELAAAKGSV